MIVYDIHKFLYGRKDLEKMIRALVDLGHQKRATTFKKSVKLFEKIVV